MSKRGESAASTSDEPIPGGAIEAETAGQRVTLPILKSDMGPGSSAGNRNKLFGRFFTTERDQGGTGLGLAIVEAVVDNRGGGITFETGAEGTTFSLVL